MKIPFHFIIIIKINPKHSMIENTDEDRSVNRMDFYTKDAIRNWVYIVT